MFNIIAKTQQEIRLENRLTIEKRCNEAVSLASKHDCTVYWCNLNDEGDLIQQLDKNAHQLKGAMSIEKKEEILLAFYNGEIKKLITKPKITCFGLNWQHCGHTTYFPTFSWEQYYQALRRFWRFGRKEKVVADVIYSDGQKRVIDSLVAKGNKASELFGKLNENLHQSFEINSKEFNKEVSLPNFLKTK